MDFGDLVTIGKLGLRQEQDGSVLFHRNRDFHDGLWGIDRVFLVTTAHRVTYTTIKSWLDDDGDTRLLFDDRYRHESGVRVLVDPETYYRTIQDDDGFHPVGMRVFEGERPVGKVVDYFHNNAHGVLVLEDENGHEIMIPDVDAWVIEKDPEKNVIRIRDMAEWTGQ